MIGIQILAMVFVVWMTYFSFLHFRRGEFALTEFIFWQIIWTGLFVVVIFPSSVKFILDTFSISRAFDLLVVGGIVILFGVTFRNYVLLRRTERKLEQLVRSLAIRQDKP
ncbi:MAG: DUF2304 family protein [Candidatus Kerfeldbacteria bacterium]|nr:DUF2304 family protein [Candidatus Kerfeldbacteria bacterium]